MTDLFNEQEQPSATVDVNDNLLNVFADKLMDIKKDDGSPKYDSLDKALDALKHSQNYIPTLEAENKLLKEKAERAAELEEVVKRLSNGDHNNSGKPDGGTPPVGGLSEQDAASLVRKILSEDKAVNTAKDNVLSVQSKLVEKYGDKASEVLKDKAKELGTTLEQLKNLSATSPAMVLALFGGSTSSPSTTTSSINISSSKPPASTITRPEKSIISGPGATDRNRAELMRKIREDVYKRNGIS